MKHPCEHQLALFAGGDIAGYWERWRISRHVTHCGRCRAGVWRFSEASQQVRAIAPEIPWDLNWNRLAEEMTGNIRDGLAGHRHPGIH